MSTVIAIVQERSARLSFTVEMVDLKNLGTVSV